MRAMTPFEAFVLALLQGVTEFLPISSSAHLILVPYILEWKDHSLTFDVVSNAGTLLAAMIYFRQDLKRTLLNLGPRMGRGVDTLLGRELDEASPGPSAPPGLAGALIIASIPVLTVAFLFRGWIETHGRQPLLIACTSIGFGLLLYWSEKVGKEERDLNDLGWWDSVVIGLSQALALLPGTSRSGITMTSGLVLGFTREEAARFSFLLAIPVGVAAFLNDLRELVSQGNWQGEWLSLTIGFVVSGISAYLVIGWLLRWLSNRSLTIFVVYRIALGLLILVLVWMR